jgi:hypothetical protein
MINSNKHFNKLFILDKAKELLIIDNEIKRIKASTEKYKDDDIYDEGRHFEEICADLLILLGDYLDFDFDTGLINSLVEERKKELKKTYASD